MTKTSMVWDELPMTGKFGAVINPGDKCWTFTGVYGGSAIAVNSGIFRGIRTVLTHGTHTTVEYIVERKNGSLSRVHYETNVAAADLTLEQLDGEIV